MTERRTGADRPAVDEEDTLIRSSRDFYGEDGVPTAGTPAVSPLSRDREEQPASPVQPRATATPDASRQGSSASSDASRQGSSASSAGGLTQKGKGRRRPAPAQQNQAPAQQNPAPVQQNSAPVQQNSAPVQQNSAPVQQNSAPAPAQRGQGQPAQGSKPASGAAAAASSASGNPPTLAERIMKRLPPPPERLRAQQAKANEARAQGRGPEAVAARSFEDDAPTRPQPRVENHPSAAPVPAQSSGDRLGANAASATATQPRASAAASAASGATHRSSAASASSGAGVTPDTSSREVMSSGGGGRTTRRTRRARLRLARVDPWSVMKTFFLFSMAGGVMACVAVGVVWTVIESSGLFDSLDQIVKDVLGQPGDDTPFSVAEYLNWQRVMAFTALLACIDIVIFTALATLGAFLYNLSATMLGGLEVTLAED